MGDEAMSCDRARNWLLKAEEPTAFDQAPVEVAEHLAQCDACQKLARRLEALERAYRSGPPPVGVDAACEKFLAGPATRPTVTILTSPANVPRRRLAPRWALAA